MLIALPYGDASEWLRNLTAMDGGRLIRAGRTYALPRPTVVDTDAAAELSSLSPLARTYCRLADKQAIFELGDPLPGFGPGHLGSQQ
ncbi:MAG: hypothetical protein GEV04_18125 [Actinophytocola sp.]|nr:hypothetical protein [Actinophytocola sp.]